jgi:hypothetical protein
MEIERYKVMNEVKRVEYPHPPSITSQCPSREDVAAYLTKRDDWDIAYAKYKASANVWDARELEIFAEFKKDLFIFHDITGSPRAELLWKIIRNDNASRYVGVSEYQYVADQFEKLVPVIK